MANYTNVNHRKTPRGSENIIHLYVLAFLITFKTCPRSKPTLSCPYSKPKPLLPHSPSSQEPHTKKPRRPLSRAPSIQSLANIVKDTPFQSAKRRIKVFNSSFSCKQQRETIPLFIFSFFFCVGIRHFFFTFSFAHFLAFLQFFSRLAPLPYS